MVARRKRSDHPLALVGEPALVPGEPLRVMRRLVNIKFPDQADQLPDFKRRLREQTEKYWPGLWTNEEQAWRVLQRIQRLLRLFWEKNDDWYIYRARFVVQRWRVQHAMGDAFYRPLRTANDVHEMNERLDLELDNPPDRRFLFEDGLHQLQELAKIPSKRPLCCANANCGRPPYESGQKYFLSERKGTKYCSEKCSWSGSRTSKLKSWNAHKKEWRKT
jgi:hypothetical protein